MHEQTKKIEALSTDVDRLQKQYGDLQNKLEKATEIEKTIDELQNELKTSRGDSQVAQNETRMLQAKLASKGVAPAANKVLQEKYQALEEKHRSTETALAEWTELAKVGLLSYT